MKKKSDDDGWTIAKRATAVRGKSVMKGPRACGTQEKSPGGWLNDANQGKLKSRESGRKMRLGGE